jgi:hypothetical protein
LLTAISESRTGMAYPLPELLTRMSNMLDVAAETCVTVLATEVADVTSNSRVSIPTPSGG